ncbi:MAG: DUF1826 domain-containing protein [Rhodobacteraceae bacterium]|nr:DUF1826 domain-containing protein [Paracoccaceae bacterium]
MRDLADHPVAGVRIADALAGLDAIHDADCAAVILARPQDPALSNWLAGLPADALPQTREVLYPEDIRATLDRLCAALPDCPERTRFIESITALAARFAQIMAAPRLRLRLEAVTGNACRRFHIDHVTARLVCTYRGTGTQYGLAAIGAEPERIHTVPTGQPTMLRGTRWPTTPPSTLKHRSPPIEGSGETRLLLVLDPVVDPQEAA